MCGVCGIISLRCSESCIEKMLECGVENLRHRGYDGFGIVTSECSMGEEKDKGFTTRRTSLLSSKLLGDESNVLRTSGVIVKEKYASELKCVKLPEKPEKLFSFETNRKNSGVWMGLAHTRYRTKGNCSIENAQPVVNTSNDIALVHNGQVKCGLSNKSVECLNSDTRHILNVFEREYQLSENIEMAVKKVFECVEGSYGCIVSIKDKGLVAFRDPRGIRPLILGVQNTQIIGDNIDSMIGQLEMGLLGACIKRKKMPSRADRVVVASESIVLEALGCYTIRDINPGEMVWIQPDGTINTYQHPVKMLSPCMFEYIYLADKRSVIDGISVSKARNTMGSLLARRMINKNLKADIIVPVPSTPNEAALTISKCTNSIYSKLIYVPCISNNEDRKTSRTFILPTQESRENAVKSKFSIDGKELLRLYEQYPRFKNLEDTHIALVDDSIVRGTTMKRIVELVKSHLKPREITILSLAPPVKYENIYGIDIPDRNSLIAYKKSEYEISSELGVDRIIYGDSDDIKDYLSKIASSNGITLNGMEDSVFSGHHTSLGNFSIEFEGDN